MALKALLRFQPVLWSTTACRLCTTAAPSEETLEEIRARIFGHHERSDVRTGRKLLKRAWRVEEIANYYPFPIRDPLLRDLDFEQKKKRQAQLRRRGKGKPPKGQGKRATTGARRRKG